MDLAGPKFNIRDKVFFIKSMSVETATITAVAFRQDQEDSSSFYYSTRTIKSWDPVYINTPENHLFRSRKELIEFLEKEVIN